MAAVTGRKFFEELGQLVSKPVVVEDTQGKTYDGILLGYDSQSMSIALGDVMGLQGKLFHRLFLTGNTVAKIMATETPFNLNGLKERLERVFPNMVQAFPEAGILVVMSKIRLNETGIIEGTGPAADRVRDIYKRFVSETT
ncbi:MAG: Lsm family RNA-binding protein [Candidatus Bathyarchaeota archaeon]|nr:Lsm family RNA-binding protein [Candidatus Bathyarchaeota archaeon]